MQFPKLAALLPLALGLAACGTEGQHWHGTLEEDGKTVEYETYYAPPGVGEKVFGGANGLAYRLVVDGKTVDSAGNHIPRDWNENKGDPMAYSAEFWGNVAEKFKAIKPGKDHEDEHTWIYNVLVDWRDTMRRPGHGQTQDQALTAESSYHSAGTTQAPSLRHSGAPKALATTPGRASAASVLATMATAQAPRACVNDRSATKAWSATGMCWMASAKATG